MVEQREPNLKYTMFRCQRESKENGGGVVIKCGRKNKELYYRIQFFKKFKEENILNFAKCLIRKIRTVS